MPDTFDAFLSYNWKDEGPVQQVYLQLQQRGVIPWLDKKELGPEPFRDQIQSFMPRIKCCVFFLGPHGFGKNQKDEIAAAHHLEKKIEGYLVIVVFLPGAKEIPPENVFLAKFSRIYFTSSVKDSEQLDQLAHWIKRTKLPDKEPASECPYRGLEKFEVQHSNVFFGRRRLTEELLTRIKTILGSPARRFLTIAGASGSGKSSLARAGLLATLQKGALEGSDQWRYATMHPGSDPLYSLAVEVGRGLGQGPGEILDFKKLLENNSQALRTYWDSHLNHQGSFVLLVDAFEELYTTCKDQAVRQAFVDNLLCASESDRALIVVAMRSDFIGNCDGAMAGAISDSFFLVSRMSVDELREVIERPAVMRNCLFEPGLVDQLLADLHKQESKEETVNLPLLQFALKELWQKKAGNTLTLAAYREIGGVEGALTNHAERIYGQFTVEQQKTWQYLFQRLTHAGEGNRPTRQRVLLRDLLPIGDPEKTNEIISKLAKWDTRLLTVDRPPGRDSEFVEVTHEALVRAWPRLKEWLNADPAGRQTGERIAQAAKQWEEKDRHRDYLLQGRLLAVMEDFERTHGLQLNQLEKEFLNSSRTEAKRKRTRYRQVMGTVIGLLALVSVSLSIAVVKMREATKLELEKQGRETEAERRLNLALGKMNELHDQAGKMPLDNRQKADLALGVWRQCLAAADEAEGLVGLNSESQPLKEQVANTKRRIETDLAAATKDARLLEELGKARACRSQARSNDSDDVGAAQHYQKTFAAYDINSDVQKAPEMARTIGAARPRVQPALILALDDWVLAATSDGLKPAPIAAVLGECADLVDTDPWRKALRKAVKENDIHLLTSLSLDVEKNRVPVVDFLLLTRALDRHGKSEQAIDLLRKARTWYPDDYWVYYDLGELLRKDPRLVQEGVLSLRTAIALNPGSV